MDALRIVVIVVLSLAAVALVWWLTRAQVESRLEATADDAGTGHGSQATDVADTGRPGGPGTEDMRPYVGDAGPGDPDPRS